jgi:hypothetical protein
MKNPLSVAEANYKNRAEKPVAKKPDQGRDQKVGRWCRNAARWLTSMAGSPVGFWPRLHSRKWKNPLCDKDVTASIEVDS